MQYFKILDTDFYQISMAFMYILLDKNKETSGYEGFVRDIKKLVTKRNYYIFSGEKEVIEFMEDIKKELNNPDLCQAIIDIISPKITNLKNKDKIIKKFKKNWKTLNKNFTYKVLKEGTKVFSYIPVFQFRGDKVIGQLIESYVTNIYNGKTAFATLKKDYKEGLSNLNEIEYDFLKGIMKNKDKSLLIYKMLLEQKAKTIRKSTNKILLEVAFRRAPTKRIADLASTTAIQNGWNGTSNVGVYMRELVKAEHIGGTMAHAYVMSFKTEEEAWISMDEVFPNGKILGDTYDVEKAADKVIKLIEEGKLSIPKEFRIDSDPIEELALMVDSKLSKYGIGNYLSGDMDEDKLNDFDKKDIPYSSTMVGTKLVFMNDLISMLNSGFVYKIVEYETIEEGKEVSIFPEKKSIGKRNYVGLKKVLYDETSNEIVVEYPSNMRIEEYGFYNMNHIKENVKITFKEV